MDLSTKKTKKKKKNSTTYWGEFVFLSSRVQKNGWKSFNLGVKVGVQLKEKNLNLRKKRAGDLNLETWMFIFSSINFSNDYTFYWPEKLGQPLISWLQFLAVAAPGGINLGGIRGNF